MSDAIEAKVGQRVLVKRFAKIMPELPGIVAVIAEIQEYPCGCIWFKVVAGNDYRWVGPDDIIAD